MNKFWTITKDVYIHTIKSPSFIILMLMPFIGLIIFGIIGFFVAQSALSTDYTVALVQEGQASTEIIEIIDKNSRLKKDIITLDKAEAALKSKDIQGYYHITGDKGNHKIEYITRNDSPTMDQATIQEQLKSYDQKQNAEILGLNEEQLNKLLASDLKVNTITRNYNTDTGEPVVIEETQQFIRMGIAYFTVFAVFFFIVNYTSIIATEISSEKGTHIMEILLSCTSANTQFLGKVTGVLLAILTQLALYGLMGLGAMRLNILGRLPIPEEFITIFSQSVGDIMGVSILLFFISCILYVVLAAMFGSFASKPEDAQKVMTPLMLICVAGFYIGMFSLMNPQALFVKITSYIPFFTPFILPFRIASENITTAGIWIALAITLVTTVAMTFLSMKIYRRSVLMYDDLGLLAKLKKAIS